MGRFLGGLLLVHFLGGLILPYVLLDRALGAPGFLTQAAAHATTIRIVVLLFMLAAALVVAMAILAASLARADAERLATALIAVGAANLALQLVESGALLTMLTVSERYVASRSEAASLQSIALVVATARQWAHYTQLLTIVGWLCLLYVTLWRTAAVPRVIAAAGIVTTLLQIAGVPGRALLGASPIMEMAMPLAPVHALLAVWLLVKGTR